MATSLVQLFKFSFIVVTANSFQLSKVRNAPHTILYYDYLGKNDGEKNKDPSRLIKNILFPGIYRDYADTVEPKKTIKITTPSPVRKSRNGDESFFSQDSKVGSYNVVDEKSAPTSDSFAVKSLPALKKVVVEDIANAAASKKPFSLNIGGVSTIPGVSKYLRPKKPIIIYEYESSADCRKVREACSMLDLIVEYKPCPAGVSGFSDMMTTLTNGRREVPFMVDNNPSMYRPQLTGAEEIINHLFKTYGPGIATIPSNLKGKSMFGGGGSKGPSMKRSARPDNIRRKSITLYGWEGASTLKKVRETLTELALPHIMVNCANGSANRESLTKKLKGNFEVPYILDPNTGAEVLGPSQIVSYLEKTYTL